MSENTKNMFCLQTIAKIYKRASCLSKWVKYDKQRHGHVSDDKLQIFLIQEWILLLSLNYFRIVFDPKICNKAGKQGLSIPLLITCKRENLFFVWFIRLLLEFIISSCNYMLNYFLNILQTNLFKCKRLCRFFVYITVKFGFLKVKVQLNLLSSNWELV